MNEPSPNSHSRVRPGIRRLLGLDVPNKNSLASELENELQMHLELRAEQLRKVGMSEEAAMHQARARYGPIDQATHEIRNYAFKREHHMRRQMTIDSFSQDIRFAFRTLARSKAWTAVAVITLALGIGANTAVFSVVNDLILEPLKYPDADRIVFISRHSKNIETVPTLEQVHAWRDAKSFERIEGFISGRQTLQLNDADPSTAHVARVSSNFARFAGAKVLTGRFLLPDDELASAPPVALVSEHVWRTKLGASTDILGKPLKIDGKQFAIVGVLMDGVRIPAYLQDAVDIWTTLPAEGFLGGPAIGRLAKGVSVEQGTLELQNILHSLDQVKNEVNGSVFTIELHSPGSKGTSRDSVFLLAGAVCLLLLIACANVAHLLLARGAQRERELAIRAALGAGRARIVRQLVTESLILSGAGCVAGLFFGQIALRAIVAVRPSDMEVLSQVQVNGRVLLVTVAISIATGLCFGLIAAFSGRTGRNPEVLRSSVGSTPNRSRNRFRSLLVVTENALSVVLLIGAIMLIRTVINLHQFNPGFDANGVYVQRVTLPESRYKSEGARELYAEQLLQGARAIGGVESATLATSAPGQTGAQIGHWVTEGETPDPNKQENMEFTVVNTVRPDYFSVMRMPLRFGRTFGASADVDHERIVSVSLAMKLWGDSNVVGKRFRMQSQVTSTGAVVWNTVVGVTPNSASASLMDRGMTPMVYFPMGRVPEDRVSLFVRMKSGTAPVAELRRLFLSIDASISPPDVVSCTELLLRTVASQRFLMALLTLFAVLAVVLSAIGLYGVITYMVSQSTREIGVRLALGAARRDVVRLVMQRGVTLSFVGLGFGLIAAIWGARLLQHMLFGVTTSDPGSYAIGATLLLLIAIGACAAPTLRAIRIDPMLAMRSE